jgi:hypothetical protein
VDLVTRQRVQQAYHEARQHEEQAQAREGEVQDLHDHVRRLERELTHARWNMGVLERQRDAAHADILKLAAQVSDLTAKLETAQRDERIEVGHRAHMEEATQAVKSLRSQLLHLHDHAKAESGELRTKLADAYSALQRRQEAIGEKTQQIFNLRETERQLRDTIQGLRRDLAHSTQVNMELVKQLGERVDWSPADARIGTRLVSPGDATLRMLIGRNDLVELAVLLPKAGVEPLRDLSATGATLMVQRAEGQGQLHVTFSRGKPGHTIKGLAKESTPCAAPAQPSETLANTSLYSRYARYKMR